MIPLNKRNRILDRWLSLPSPGLTFHSLDILRGLAALWVALFHSMPDYAYTEGTSSIGDCLFKAIMNTRGVDMFFVISGYCISGSALKNSESPQNFLEKRIRRIYPTYWISIVFGAVIVSLITLSGLGKSADWPVFSEILVSLPLLVENQIGFNGVYWSLVHEVHFYLIAYIALAFFRKHFMFVFDAVLLVWIASGFLEMNPASVPVLGAVSLTRHTFFTFYCGSLVFRTIHDVRQ